MVEIGFVIGAAVAILGALMGVGIRRITKFLYPYDFLSIAVYVGLIVLSIVTTFAFRSITIDAMIYLAFIMGYVFGYAIDGARAYIIVRRRIPNIKSAPGEPWVIYEVKGRKALAIQTNMALFQRLILKNHVFIICDSPIVADWIEPTKYPVFPLFNKKMMMVDDCKIVDVRWSVDVGKEKHPKRQAMWVKKAHGSLVSIDRLCFEADAVTAANEATAEAQRKHTQLVHFIKAGMSRFFANFIAETYDKSPGLAFMEATRRAEEIGKGLREDTEVMMKTQPAEAQPQKETKKEEDKVENNVAVEKGPEIKGTEAV